MIEIKVDKRTELLGMLLSLSNYTKLVPNMYDKIVHKDYEKKVLDYLKPFKNHKAVEVLNEIIDNVGMDFAYDRPISVFMQMDENFNFLGENEAPFCTRLKRSKLVLDFLNEVKVFAKDIDFEKFYEENKPFYDKCIIQHENLLRPMEDRLFKFIEEFYMFTPNEENYKINILLHQASGSNGIKTGDVFYCHEGEYKELPQNPTNIESLAYTSWLLHEFSHPIINPITDKNRVQYKEIPSFGANKMSSCYTGVDTYINESIIRAIQTYYLEKAVEHKLPDSYNNHKRAGFDMVEKLVDKLHEIEGKTFNCFEDKYDELLQILKYENQDKSESN